MGLKCMFKIYVAKAAHWKDYFEMPLLYVCNLDTSGISGSEYPPTFYKAVRSKARTKAPSSHSHPVLEKLHIAVVTYN